jgi:hypothetical protein
MGNTPQDRDFEPLTRLLDTALEFAENTWNEEAYYVLVAAGKLAFTDRLRWQVINTARFLGTNVYFTEWLNLGGVDKFPRDFVAMADTLTREGIRRRVVMEKIDASLEARHAEGWVRDHAAGWDEDKFYEEWERDRPLRKARSNAAWADARAYRNHRARDNA